MENEKQNVGIENYNMSGVLAFLQREWCQFERERLKWQVDRNQLLSHVAKIEGERKAMEVSQHDLLRRVKMLEYSLKRERDRNPDSQIEIERPTLIDLTFNNDDTKKKIELNKTLIKQYLEELQFTDKVIESKAERLRASFNIEGSALQAMKKIEATAYSAHMNNTNTINENNNDTIPQYNQQQQVKAKASSSFDTLSGPPKDVEVDSSALDDDLMSENAKKAMEKYERKESVRGRKENSMSMIQPDKQLSINLKKKSSSLNKRSINHKSKWKIKYSVRNHYDAIRCVAFHNSGTLFVSCSEDRTVKVWTLPAVQGSKSKGNKGAEFEPILTLRGHVGPVFALAISSEDNLCFTGGSDNKIRVWNLPDHTATPYSKFDPNTFVHALDGHSDCIWKLDTHPNKKLLVSCSADGSCKLWNTSGLLKEKQDKKNYSDFLIGDFKAKTENGAAISASFIRSDHSKIAIGYQNGQIVLFNIENREEHLQFQNNGVVNEDGEGNSVFDIATTAIKNLVVAGYKDGNVRVFDIEGNCQKEISAHPTSVISLSIDAAEQFIATCSHERSVRFWDFDKGSCVQEITGHRAKFDEAIHSVVFHPEDNLLVSAGADAIIKIYQYI